MRLARKLTLALALGILAVMGLYAVFQVRQEIELSEDDLLRAQRVGRAWLGTIESVWDHEGSERAHELVRLATQRAHEIELRILSLDAATVEAPLSAEERATLLSGKRVRRERQDPRGMARREVFVPMKTRDGPQMIVEYVEPAHHTRAFIRMSHQ